MRAVQSTEAGIQVVDVPEPEGDGALLRIAAASICGTDLHMTANGRPLRFTLGHEFAGHLPDDTPVAAEPFASCGSCDQCATGNRHRCRMGAAANLGFGANGGMAEWVRVPEESLVPLPAALPVANASLVEPAGVALHGLRRAGVEGGQRVLVVGGGAIGLIAAAAARDTGCEVGLLARHPRQIAIGETLDAVPPSGEYDVAIDAAGSDTGLRACVKWLRPGGRLVLLGVYLGDIPLPGGPTLIKEIEIIASMAYSHHGAGRDIDSAAVFLGHHPALADALVTHRFPLEDAAEAFRVAGDRASGAIRVVLEP